MPLVVFYAGIGGLSKGAIAKKGDLWGICAVAIEGDENVAIAHQLNNPSIPVAVHHMCKTAEVLSLIERYLPKCHWHKAWLHASNS